MQGVWLSERDAAAEGRGSPQVAWKRSPLAAGLAPGGRPARNGPMRVSLQTSVLCLWLTVPMSALARDAPARVPILYSSDLYHPHQDPDDHFDLATLFCLKEFDLRGIVLDDGSRQREAPGRIPVEQMLQLSGRQVPVAIGLGRRLASPKDDGRAQAAEFQKGVDLILDVLRRSPRKVVVFTTGSLRDVAAALNRAPELLRRKVARLYVNIGDPAPAGGDHEYNVKLDPNAYVRVLRSGLPVYWCPCFDGGIWQRGDHGTYWRFVQGVVLEAAPADLQNWFIYALTKPRGVDPLGFLTAPQQADVRRRVWAMPRNMWCTGPFLHAAGRKVYRRGPDDFVALSPERAQERGLQDDDVAAFRFVPMRVVVGEVSGSGPAEIHVQLRPQAPNGWIFQRTDPRYDEILTACLKHLFAAFETAKREKNARR